VIARLRNCILALADQRMMLYDTSVMYAYEASAHFQVKHFSILKFVKQLRMYIVGIRTGRQVLCVHLPGGSTILHEMTSWLPS